jgi:hypothetical protein
MLSRSLLALTIVATTMTTPAMARDLTMKEKTVIANAIRAFLADPGFSRFRWLPIREGHPDLYCAYVTAPREAEAPYMIFLRWHEDELVGAGPVNIARGALVVATIAETCKNFSPLL